MGAGAKAGKINSWTIGEVGKLKIGYLVLLGCGFNAGARVGACGYYGNGGDGKEGWAGFKALDVGKHAGGRYGVGAGQLERRCEGETEGIGWNLVTVGTLGLILAILGLVYFYSSSQQKLQCVHLCP